MKGNGGNGLGRVRGGAGDGVVESGVEVLGGGEAEDINKDAEGEGSGFSGIDADAFTVVLNAKDAAGPLEGDASADMDTTLEGLAGDVLEDFRDGNDLSVKRVWFTGALNGNLGDAGEEEAGADELAIAVEDGCDVSADSDEGINEVLVSSAGLDNGDATEGASGCGEIEGNVFSGNEESLDEPFELDPLSVPEGFSGFRNGDSGGGGRHGGGAEDAYAGILNDWCVVAVARDAIDLEEVPGVDGGVVLKRDPDEE